MIADKRIDYQITGIDSGSSLFQFLQGSGEELIDLLIFFARETVLNIEKLLLDIMYKAS